MVTQETKPAGGLRRIGVSLSTVLALLGAMVSSLTTLRAQVPEPETVFYGRIVNRTSGQEYLVTSGTLTWTVNGGAPSPITVTTQLSSLKGGKYSYVVKLPHQAKSAGLSVETGALPLHIGDADFESSSIRVNGQPARPLNAGSAVFVASQPRRGGVHRLDLEVFDPLEDSDNDGIPDWWEDRFGLDKNWAGDALMRHGSNRFTYLEAFRLGLDPTVDDQVPELLTKEITVAAKGSTGLLLRAVDSQSQPAQIRYRLLNQPAGSTIMLRNARPDPRLAHRALSIGDEFTQADVDAGRVEYLHKDGAVEEAVIRVTIRNGNAAIGPITRQVAVTVFQPEAVEGRAGELLASEGASSANAPSGTAAELWKRRATDAFASEWIGGASQRDRVAASLLAKWFDYTLWDGTSELPARDLSVPSAGLSSAQYTTQYARQYGTARKHVILAGTGHVRISGGMSDDVLVSGEGHTIARGNGGRDIFVAGRGTLEVADFHPGEGDVLDLSALLAGNTEAVEEKVQTTANATDTQLRIPLGTGSNDAIVLLKNIKLTAKDLGRLAVKGNIFTGAPRSGAFPANRLPVAVTDYGYVAGTASIVIPVLANDRDADGDALSLSSVSNPAAGLAVISGNTVIYTPGPTFAGQDSFTYTVSDGRDGWASGTVEISYPFPVAAGTYLPLVVDEEGKPVGELRVQLGGTGAFTATLRAAGARYFGRGRFDADGFAEVTLKAGRKLLTLQLSIDLADPNYPMEGSISGGSDAYSVLSEVALAQSGASKLFARRHTVVLRAPEGDAGVAGHGFGTLAVRSAQRGTVAGVLADGTRFSAGVSIRGDGTVRWTAKLYKGSGWLLGTLQLGGANAGTTRWFQSGASGGSGGFDRSLVTSHSVYQAPSVASVHALNFTDPTSALAQIQMSGGFLGLPGLNGTLVFGIADVVKPQSAGAFTIQLRLNRATGTFAGTLGFAGVSRPIRGAVLQNENRGFGHVGDASPSAVEIIPQ